MALQVWLPLDGTLNNNGLSNLIFTNLGASNTTVSTAGKIGSCYQNNAFTAGGMRSNTTIDLGINQSMFCWVNFTTLNSSSSLGGSLVSQHRYVNNTGMGLTIKYVSSTTGYLSVNTGNGSSRTYNTYCATTLMNAGTWYHVGYTYDGAQIKLYVNGVCEKTQAYTGMSVPADYLVIFCWSMGSASGNGVQSTYCLNGKLNDVRIYDHCLTPFEVKEISQGLVLHYQFDDAYIEQTTNLCGASAGGWDNSGTCTRTANDTAIPEPPTTSNTYSIRATSDGSMAAQIGTTPQNHPSKTIIASTYVWLDGTQDSSPFYLRSVKTDGTVGSLLYKGNANPTTWPQRQWIQIATNAITTASDATRFYICTYVNKNTEVRAFNGWQIEENNHITPYTSPGTTRGARTKVFDSSGYSHNGTIINNPTLDTLSPRYCVCTHFNATNQKVQCGVLNTAAFGNSYSFAWWAKMVSNGPMHWGFSDGNRLNGLYGGNTWNTGDGNSNPLYNPGTTTQVTAPTAGVWHHFVMTGDGTTCKVYQDGVLWATAKIYKPINGTQIFINGWADATSYSSDNYSISDFRIYATALSADDVKKLYETSMSIDSAGNISARLLN